MLIIPRRKFLTGIGAGLCALAAPAIVRAENIMRVRQVLILPSEEPIPALQMEVRTPDGQWQTVRCSTIEGTTGFTSASFEIPVALLDGSPIEYRFKVRQLELSRGRGQIVRYEEHYPRSPHSPTFDGVVANMPLDFQGFTASRRR